MGSTKNENPSRVDPKVNLKVDLSKSSLLKHV